MGQQWERSLFCQFQLLGSYWEVHWLKLTPGLNRVLGGKTTPPNIFFRPILPKFKEIFEIVVGDFERWPMLPVRKTNGKCHFKFPVFWNIPLCCHITDNVLNVYSLGLILLISTSSCFKAPARALIIWIGFIDWNRPDYLTNSLDGFPQKMPTLILPTRR